MNGLLVWTLWERLPFREAPFAQGFLTFVGYGVFAMFTKAVFHPTLDRFWARQVYPIRTRFWFSPEMIAFQSRLYDQGILLWRNWRDQPVQARFDLTTDLEAASLKASYHKPDAQSNPLWQTAHLLRITISSTHPQQASALTGQPQLIRAIPIMEIDLRDAQSLTVVLTAAATLTAPHPDRERIEHQGLDLDTLSVR